MITIGIDVGLRGALASLDEAGDVVLVGDLPLAIHGKQKWIHGGKMLTMLYAARRVKQPCRVLVEYMNAMPMIANDPEREGETTRGGGAWAASMKGMALGSVLSTLQIAQLTYEMIMPQKWKRAMNLIMPHATYLERKRASLGLARQLFPRAPLQLEKHDGRAEALLIAEYGRRRDGGQLALVGGGNAA